MSTQDYRTNMDMWIDMYGEMEDMEDYHPPKEKLKPQPSAFAKDILDQNPNLTRSQDAFYDYLDSMDQFIDDPVAPASPAYNRPSDNYAAELDYEELFQEERTPNPVYPDSVGPDNQGPKPAWVNEDLLKEVEALKNRLFKVENAMARMGQGKKWNEKPIREDNRLFGEIKSLKSRIDKLSSKLGIEDEPSPWQTKRD